MTISYEIQLIPHGDGRWSFTATTTAFGSQFTTSQIPLTATTEESAFAEAESMTRLLANLTQGERDD